MREHTLHPGPLCHQVDAAGRSLLAVPLFSPCVDRARALAIIRLHRVYQITGATEQLIQQIALPLEVALEREVLYWSIEQERQKAYNRSIRDPLTGLFTCFYMQDVMDRYCAMHDRDANSPVGASSPVR